MSTADGSPSRQSKTNRHEESKGAEPSDLEIDPTDMGASGLRPLSVDGARELRDEALSVDLEDGGAPVPMESPNVNPEDGTVKSRPWYRVVNEHTDWYCGYEDSHIEFEDPDGETVRAPLENSYQPEYGDRYYARLMDLKRGIERRWTDFSIAMLTLSASTLNQDGQPRCPADHMRDIAAGWDVARKQLYEALRGRRWTYARVWEPTSSEGQGPAGYGHMHVAVFVEDGDDLAAGEFRPFMESYVDNCKPAGWDAHRPDGDAVSVTTELEEANAATYISEYIGQYGEELYDRPVNQRAFLAVTWATGTRRVDFSNDAQEIVATEEFRRETGLRPEDRGTREGAEGDTEGADKDGEGEAGWSLRRMCRVDVDGPDYYEPDGGGVDRTELDPVDGVDRPRDLGPPPGGGG